MTASSLKYSQTIGDVRGSIAFGIPGTKVNANAPAAISSAEAAGSRPEKKRGIQKEAIMLAPMAARATW
jgi:hypothetical protein